MSKESAVNLTAPGTMLRGLSEQETLEKLPLFLLGLVLFPGGMLRLQVFEQRYLRMVKQVMRTGSPFGVCLVVPEVNPESGQTQTKGFATIGCKAQIIDFDSTSQGLLQIDCQGTQRFRVIDHQTEGDGLVTAQIQTIAADAKTPVPTELEGCSSLVKELVKEIEGRLANQASRVVATPYEFDSSSWVSNRLCELLPVSMATRQNLMALHDPVERLTQVDQFLHDQSIFNSDLGTD